jgi:molybdopterin-guanine dinucleotide biosynthesis protein A
VTPDPISRDDARVVGVVLAGGRSSRMGRPKHAIVLPDGHTMLDRVVGALLRCVSRVAVVGLSRRDHRRAGPDAVTIPDRHPGRGPLAGIHAALTDLDVEGCLIAACDQPLLDERVLLPLLARDPQRACCLVSAAGHEVQPLPLYLPSAARPDVEEELLRGRGAVRGLLDRIPHDNVVLPPELEPAIRSLNTPRELARYRSEFPAERQSATLLVSTGRPDFPAPGTTLLSGAS